MDCRVLCALNQCASAYEPFFWHHQPHRRLVHQYVQAALQEIRKAQKPHRMAIVPVDEEGSQEEEAEEQFHTVRPRQARR